MSDERRSPSWRTVIVAGLVGFLVNALTPSDALGIAAFVAAVAISARHGETLCLTAERATL